MISCELENDCTFSENNFLFLFPISDRNCNLPSPAIHELRALCLEYTLIRMLLVLWAYFAGYAHTLHPNGGKTIG